MARDKWQKWQCYHGDPAQFQLICIKVSQGISNCTSHFDFFDLRQFNNMHPKHKI
jgi:hypothetical protein